MSNKYTICGDVNIKLCILLLSSKLILSGPIFNTYISLCFFDNKISHFLSNFILFRIISYIIDQEEKSSLAFLDPIQRDNYTAH